MRGGSKTAGTVMAIAEVPDLSRHDLAELWTKVYGHAPPKGLSRRLLEHAAAHHLQSQSASGLKPTIRRKLCKSATASPNKVPLTPKSVGLSPGSRLIREWHGRIHTVDVLETGFLYDGNHYGSLSHVARAITGARWSGPRFFKL
jgi:hypothetical protein